MVKGTKCELLFISVRINPPVCQKHFIIHDTVPAGQSRVFNYFLQVFHTSLY